MEVSTKPGIYCFTNSVNGKCYVGQAVNLRNRYNSHIGNFKAHRYDNPLYRAFTKYGLDKFTYEVLEIIEEVLEQKLLKDRLDKLEIRYISEKNSYNNGYNQTKGGDGGIMGYKFTEEQLKKRSETTKRVAMDGRYTIFVYDIKEEKSYEFLNMEIAATALNLNAEGVRNAKTHKRWYLGRYYFSTDPNAHLEKQPSKYTDSSMYLEEYYNYLKQFDVVSIKQVSSDLGITEDTVKKRNQKLRNLGYTDLPFKSHNKIKYVEVTNILNNTTTNYTIKDLATLLGLSEKAVRKQINRPNVYKKTYLFNVVYEQ